MQIEVEILPHAKELSLPKHATPDSAGIDFLAAISHPLILHPLQRTLVPTGLCIAIPQNYEMQIRPRSGLALKHGITVLNSPGTIDADYRGEIKILLINIGEYIYQIHRGERIAQGILSRYEQVSLVVVNALDPTHRGVGGFGSTG